MERRMKRFLRELFRYQDEAWIDAMAEKACPPPPPWITRYLPWPEYETTLRLRMVESPLVCHHGALPFGEQVDVVRLWAQRHPDRHGGLINEEVLRALTTPTRLARLLGLPTASESDGLGNIKVRLDVEQVHIDMATDLCRLLTLDDLGTVADEEAREAYRIVLDFLEKNGQAQWSFSDRHLRFDVALFWCQILPEVLVERVLPEIQRSLLEEAAARCIQRAWLECYYDPGHAVCRRRIARWCVDEVEPPAKKRARIQRD
jgi:hypothetical protein